MDCPVCGRSYGSTVAFCPHDGTPLGGERTVRGPPRDPMLRSVVAGRFRIEERLGAGGCGVVYRADQLSVERPVALKLLAAEIAADLEQRQRFRVEARTISRLTSPHTVRLLDFGETEDGRFYYAMEYLEGQSLAAAGRQGPLSVERALRVCDEALSSLEEAADEGIVHRDIKPENIFLQRVAGADVTKVLDFGIAHLIDASTRSTESGAVFGTPAYMSPEQARGLPVDHRTDLYALGVVLFELLCGRRPFGGTNAASLLYQHVHEAPPALGEVLPGSNLPEALDELVQDLLAKEPSERGG